MDCTRAVAEITRFDFERIYNMPVMEFFAYVAYINFDRRRTDNKLKAINRKYAK